MTGWRAALRLARREARRAPGRSALVVALIGLPVWALTVVAVTYDSFRPAVDHELTRTLGAADAGLSWRFDGPAVQAADPVTARAADPDTDRRDTGATAAELRRVLPPGTRVVPRHGGRLELRTAAGQAGFPLERLDLTDPIHRGRVVLRSGRPPTGGGQAALTRRAADRLGAGLGDEIATAAGDRHWTVVGIAEYPHRFRVAVLLPAPGGPAGAGGAAARDWLVDTPVAVTWAQVRQLNRHGIVVRSREVLRHPPPPSQVDPAVGSPPRHDPSPAVTTGVLVAGLALLEVVLLAGPAFAVGARRRQRELALVAAGGGTPAQQRRIVLADGVVLGAVGAVAGIALGVASTIAALPLLEEYLLGRRAGGFGVFPPALAGIAGLAVVTGLAAALVPAAAAARQPVVTALADRRGAVRSRTRWWVLGLVATGSGAALAGAGAARVETDTVLTGLVLGQLGLVLVTPALVGLVARLGRLLPLAPRVALRDTARNRAAAAPAISAVMAAVTGALALGVYLTADEQRRRDSYQAGLPVGHVAVPYQVSGVDGERRLPAGRRAQVRAALAAALPGARVRQVAVPACPADAAAQGCGVAVPVPPERRCPAEELLDRRVEEALVESGSVDLGSVLSAAEQRAARADPRCQEPQLGWRVHLGRSVVGDGAALPVLVGGDRADLAAAAAVLDRGGVVVADERTVVDGRATLEVRRRAGGRERVRELTVPAYPLTSGAPVPFAVVSPATLDRAGLAAQPSWVVAATTAVPTREQQDALRRELAAVHPDLRAQVEDGLARDAGDPFPLVLGAVAAIVALAAAAIATGLAAADRRADLTTLAAVGAAPRVRRTLSTSQSGVVAGLGTLLGTGAGLGSAYAVLAALNQAEARVWPVPAPPYPLVVPWPAIALLLVVPVVAMLGAGLLTRSRLPVERRRAH